MPPHDGHHRPLYHFSPPENWMNDPNGLVYYRGEYHLFYQYHPGSSVWGPMHWGHAVSADLTNWQHLPVALYPDENGAIFSGCAVIDWVNTAGFGKEAMVAIFTHDRPHHAQSQSLAYSNDRGRTWTKYPGNPVLLAPENLQDFRDPKVFWYGAKDNGQWVMLLAAHNAIRFYTSPDLIHWEPGGIFGEEHGAHGGVWETPDMFELPVDGGAETRWMLTAGVGNGGPGGISGMQYFVGSFDGFTFASENPKDTILWADFGADYYAAQSWSDLPDDRRLMIGWQANWQYAGVVPTETWRGICNLPRAVSLRQTPGGIRMFQQPTAEIYSLRGEHSHWENQIICSGMNLLKDHQGDSFEIAAEFQSGSAANCFGFRVRTGEGEQTTIGYDAGRKKLFVDRTQSGECAFDPGFPRVHEAPMNPVNGVVRLQIFLDRCTVEVFGNDGEVVIADTIFPGEASWGMELYAEGGEVLLNKLDLYRMQPASFSYDEQE